jgi:Hemerythrin HHE cation binding domain
MDITQLILDDHYEQRRLFAIVEQIEKADSVRLGEVWSRLASFLEIHAVTEEEIFYPALLHNEIRDST